MSDDNPYIEAHFKTLKYCPAWPGHFDTLDDARAWCEQFFEYYNHVHRHRALGLHTPASVHYDGVESLPRGATLDAAYAANRHASPSAHATKRRRGGINQPRRREANGAPARRSEHPDHRRCDGLVYGISASDSRISSAVFVQT